MMAVCFKGAHSVLSHILVPKLFRYAPPPALRPVREGEMMISFKGAHFAKDIILTCVRWYIAYPLSYRQLEELMQEHGVAVDHATIQGKVLGWHGH
jgi:hypothetical protein